jgi:hypothetical protein
MAQKQIIKKTKAKFSSGEARLLKAMNSQFGVLNRKMDHRFDGIDQRFDGIDSRLDVVDLRLEKVDLRFDGIDARFVAIVPEIMAQVDKKFDEFVPRMKTELINYLAPMFEDTQEKARRGNLEMGSKLEVKFDRLSDAIKRVVVLK